MADYLPKPPSIAAGSPAGLPAAGSEAAKPPLSDAQIEELLAGFQQKQRRRPESRAEATGLSALLFSQGAVARSLFLLAGLLLISNGMEGLRVRAESSTSLIAVNINHRGGQSLGLGFAMLAMGVMPYGSGHQKPD